MAESKKNSIIVMCSLVACIVTLITCGVLIGNMQGTQKAQGNAVVSLVQDVKKLTTNQTAMKSEQSYLKGVVSTKLDNLYAAVTRIETQVNEYESVGHGKKTN